MAANAGIAVSKLVAAYFSESTALIAEGVHSLADTANQGLLLVGILLSARKADEKHPFGRAAESYFWSFIVALLLFFLGGVFAIYEGLHKLSHPAPPGSPWLAIGVLVVSVVLEGSSFVVAFREFDKQRGGRPFREALFDGKDPVIPIVLLEDSGAVLGLLVALFAVVVSFLTGSSRADSIGSIVIGVLLCGIGFVLARDTKSLLIGEGVTPAVRAKVVAIIESTPGVESVRQFLSLHLGADTILLALKVRFTPGFSLSDVERSTNDLEARVRAEVPSMKRIFVEPDSQYDASLDRGEDESPLAAPTDPV